MKLKPDRRVGCEGSEQITGYGVDEDGSVVRCRRDESEFCADGATYHLRVVARQHGTC